MFNGSVGMSVTFQKFHFATILSFQATHDLRSHTNTVCHSLFGNVSHTETYVGILNIYHFNTSDQRKLQVYISHISLWSGI